MTRPSPGDGATPGATRAQDAGAWIAIGLLGVLCAGLGWFVGQRYQAASAPPLPPGVTVVEPGDPVPPMTLADFRTGALRPLSLPGRPRMLNYWASWCGPCREEMPLLDAFAASQGPDGVEVVGIALDSRRDAQAFLEAVPVRFPLLIEVPGPADSSVVLGNRRGLLPFTALVDADGRLVKTHTGPFPDAATLAEWARVDSNAR